MPRTNQERGDKVWDVLENYTEDDDVTSNLIDLLADIRHAMALWPDEFQMADSNLTFDEAVRISGDHFEAERDGEGGAR